jgi:hypothetical protein
VVNKYLSERGVAAPLLLFMRTLPEIVTKGLQRDYGNHDNGS